MLDSLDGAVKRIVARARKHNLQVSPFIVIVGENVDNIVDSYVYVEAIQYRATSVCHALDICMKAVHVLHVSYQKQSANLWMLIQKLLYKINTAWDFRTAVVDTFCQKYDSC